MQLGFDIGMAPAMALLMFEVAGSLCRRGSGAGILRFPGGAGISPAPAPKDAVAQFRGICTASLGSGCHNRGLAPSKALSSPTSTCTTSRRRSPLPRCSRHGVGSGACAPAAILGADGQPGLVVPRLAAGSPPVVPPPCGGVTTCPGAAVGRKIGKLRCRAQWASALWVIPLGAYHHKVLRCVNQGSELTRRDMLHLPMSIARRGAWLKCSLRRRDLPGGKQA